MNSDEMALLAEKIWIQYDGSDNKRAHAVDVQAIYEWLREGDGGAGQTVQELVEEWREYNGED